MRRVNVGWLPVDPDPNMFVVLSTDKTELVSKKVAGPSSGFVSMLILGVLADTGGGGVRWVSAIDKNLKQTRSRQGEKRSYTGDFTTKKTGTEAPVEMFISSSVIAVSISVHTSLQLGREPYFLLFTGNLAKCLRRW